MCHRCEDDLRNDHIVKALLKYLTEKDNLVLEDLTTKSFLVPKISANCTHGLHDCPMIGNRDCKQCSHWEWNCYSSNIVY